MQSLSASINIPENAHFAETVLMPGDPRRAEYIAGKFLKNAVKINSVRNMSAFTGTYKDTELSVMGSGMGIPSFAIYAEELFSQFGVGTIIRTGTAGGLSEKIRPRDVIIASAASSDSRFYEAYGLPGVPAAASDTELLMKAVRAAENNNISASAGCVFTSDHFCYPDPSVNLRLRDFGHLGIDMETAGLYWTAAACGKRALSVLTVSNHLISGESLDSEARERSFDEMIVLALETAIA